MHFQGLLYRALNPVYAREPLSGRGAELYGGRFNAKGTPALYTSLSVLTALRESNQVGHLQPTTLVCYEADIDGVFDTRDASALRARGMDDAALADPTWRNASRRGGLAPTQVFSRKLMEDGFHGLLVRSFVHGARADEFNLVLWRWGDRLPHRLTLVDDEDRLT